MKITDKENILPVSIMTMSLVAIILIMGLTSPVDNIAYAIIFFILMEVFLVSTGYSIVRLQFGVVSPKARYRIIIISSLVLLAVMLRSLQSLNIVDLLIVGLITFGLIFYTSRRSS